MNLRTASLADVGPTEVDELRTIGETLFVERKVMAKPVRDILGPAVASFANTLGGWVLLGVEDDRGAEPGRVRGWAPEGRASAQDYVRDLLQGNVDPVPPFAAKVVQLNDGQTVGVVRVAESVDVPHVVAPTGSVWTRGQGGKGPITSYRDLMALAERGRAAWAKADERLTSLPHVENIMRASPDHITDADDHDVQTLTVRIAPIMVPDTFADAALSAGVAEPSRRSTRCFVPSGARARMIRASIAAASAAALTSATVAARAVRNAEPQALAAVVLGQLMRHR